MKNGKLFFIAIIFLVSFLCISAVSAADDAASDIAAQSDDAVIDEGINEVLKVNSASLLVPTPT